MRGHCLGGYDEARLFRSIEGASRALAALRRARQRQEGGQIRPTCLQGDIRKAAETLRSAGISSLHLCRALSAEVTVSCDRPLDRQQGHLQILMVAMLALQH